MYTSMVYTPSVSLFISWKINILDSCLRFNKRYGEYRKLKKQEFILSEGGHVFWDFPKRKVKCLNYDRAVIYNNIYLILHVLIKDRGNTEIVKVGVI